MATISTNTTPFNIVRQDTNPLDTTGEDNTSLDISKMNAKQMLEKFKDGTLRISDRAKMLLGICKASEKGDITAIQVQIDIINNPTYNCFAFGCSKRTILDSIKNYSFSKCNELSSIDISFLNIPEFMFSGMDSIYVRKAVTGAFKSLNGKIGDEVEAYKAEGNRINKYLREIKDIDEKIGLILRKLGSYSLSSILSKDVTKLSASEQADINNINRLVELKNIIQSRYNKESSELFKKQEYIDVIRSKMNDIEAALNDTNSAKMLERLQSRLREQQPVTKPEIIGIQNKVNIVDKSVDKPQPRTVSVSPTDKKEPSVGERYPTLDPNTAPRSQDSDKRSVFGNWLSGLFSKSGKGKSPESAPSKWSTWVASFKQKFNWFGSKSTVNPNAELVGVKDSRFVDVHTRLS